MDQDLENKTAALRVRITDLMGDTKLLLKHPAFEPLGNDAAAVEMKSEIEATLDSLRHAKGCLAEVMHLNRHGLNRDEMVQPA